MKQILRFAIFVLYCAISFGTASAQVIYSNGFEGGGIAGTTSFTGGATGDPNLNIAGSTWSTDGSFVTFTGNAPTAATSMALQPATATTTTWTLTLPVDPGYTATVTGLQFDYRSTSTSYNFIAITLNGTLIYTGSASTASTWYTVVVPPFSIAGITGNIVLASTFSGGTHGGSSTFRYDNVSLTGTVVSACIPPSISVTPPSGSFCSGGAGVSLSASGAGVGGTYAWETAAGLSASTGASVIATPASTTVYTVVGTTSAGCKDSTTVTVSVNPLPAAVVTASGPLSFCPGGSVTLTASSGAGYTYQWYDGTSLITGATNINYTATTAGNYTVVVYNSSGCSNTSIVSAVTISPTPVATITASGSTTICSGANVVLSATAPGAGDTYQWYNGTTAISGATDASYTAGTAGTYFITITTPAGCSGTTVSGIAVTVNPVPVVTTTASGPLSFCMGGNVKLTCATGPGNTYQWYDIGGPISGATDDSYTALTSGDYYVVVSNTFGCTATSATFPVVVNPLPVTTVLLSGPATICPGDSVMLSTMPGVGYTYQWYNGGAAIGGATNSYYYASAAGDFTVLVTTSFGCAATSTVTTISTATPVITVVSGDTSSCGAVNVVLSVGAVSGALYQWNRNGIPITGSNSSTYTATTTGLYSCSVDMPGGCNTTTAAIHVSANSAPVPVIYFDGTTLSTLTTYAYYQWYINGTPIFGATSYSIAAYSNLGYTVRVIDSNGCVAYSQAFYLSAPGIINSDEIKIYPNPANNIVHVQCSEKLNVMITGIEGKIIMTQKDATAIDISQLERGIYLIELFDESGVRKTGERLIKN